ncbi:MAG TPA: pseudouridine synthase [Candidatus Binatia bacterium]|nr:pseudouridine synthase [Candidatus Binatia bacterium]
MRLNQFLARRGVASRRGADQLIGAGRVTVNRAEAMVGAAVDPDRDRVEVDGRPVAGASAVATIMLNKPPGIVTTVRDPQHRPTVMGLLSRSRQSTPSPGLLPGGRPRPGRRGIATAGPPTPPGPTPASVPGLVPVGRLDASSRGLLLLSSDGELVHRLTHPRYGVAKRYRVTLAEPASAAHLRLLTEGVDLEDGRARATSARRGSSPAQIELVMEEGRKREVRRLCAALGLEVIDLVRVAFGPLRLGDLEEGAWRWLTAAELRRLRASVGLEPK